MKAITTKYEKERNLKKIQPGKLARKVSPNIKLGPQEQYSMDVTLNQIGDNKSNN